MGEGKLTLTGQLGRLNNSRVVGRGKLNLIR